MCPWQRHGLGILIVALAALAVPLSASRHRSIVAMTKAVFATEQDLRTRVVESRRINRQDLEATRAALAVAKQELQRQEETLQRLDQQYLELQARSAAFAGDARQGIAVMACHQVAYGWRDVRQVETELKSVKDDIASFIDIVKTAEAASLGKFPAKFTLPELR